MIFVRMRMRFTILSVVFFLSRDAPTGRIWSAKVRLFCTFGKPAPLFPDISPLFSWADEKKQSILAAEKEIVYSRVVKAGKRIYYLDVKRSRKNELFLSITESKKIPAAAPGIAGEEPSFTFEKHKIFLYQEDFEKFMAGLQQAIQFIQQEQGESTFSDTTPENSSSEANSAETKQTAKPDSSTLEGEIKIDIDF